MREAFPFRHPARTSIAVAIQSASTGIEVNPA
jgi:hypothetical protein